MDHTGSQSRRHLHSSEELERAFARSTSDVDLTRAHGQSNGLRVHGAYFAAVSLAALLLLVLALGLGASMM